MCDHAKIETLLRQVEEGTLEEVEITYCEVEILNSEFGFEEPLDPCTITVSSYQLESFTETCFCFSSLSKLGKH